MNLNLTPATRYGLNTLGLVAVTVSLYFGASIFLPVTIAALLAACLWQPARWIHTRLHLPWFVSCTTILFLLVTFAFAVFISLATSFPQLIEDFKPQDYERQRELYAKIRSMTIRLSPFPINESNLPEEAEKSTLFQQIRETLSGQRVTDVLLDTLKFGGRLFWQGVLVLFIVLFMLLEGEMLAKKLKGIFGTESESRKRVAEALAEMAESVRTYLVWRTIINFALAIVLGAIYKACGVKQWYLWALVTAILTYIPYLGPIIAGLLPVLDALIFQDNPAVGIGLGFFYVAVVTFEGYAIVPWLMGRKMNLNATTVMAGCLYWDYVWGTAGLFLAMPLLAAMKSVCLNVEGWRQVGRLMGSEEEIEPAAPMTSQPVVDLKPAEEKTEIISRTEYNGVATPPNPEPVSPVS